MNLAPMRFNGVQWHHNPREITFECDSEVSELKALYGTSYIQNLGRRNMKISGEGELYGEDCTELVARIFELFKRGGAGVLAIPGLSPVSAVVEAV
ncbi:MAG: DNA circularization N-terminal domain-containing protein, partial [Clostridiales bacterium]|nr:DNA circularization N-terminal domain-containing protein [Clostridiales bacterium]